MKIIRDITIFTFILIIPLFSVISEEISLNTSSLDSWDPLIFPKIPEHSTFSNVEEDGESAIRIDSEASASALIYSETFSLKQTPYLSWEWKAMNIFEKGDASTKAGDDYPIRVYILFPYSKDRVPFFERFQFELANALYGEYPPAEVINYVWANRPQPEDLLPNAYTDRAMMFLVESGDEHLGQWRLHKRNILEDFKLAFKNEPPDTFTLAIMGDTDNTGDKGVSFIRDLILSSD